MLYQYRYKEFETLKEAQDYINRMHIDFDRVSSSAIIAGGASYIARIEIEIQHCVVKQIDSYELSSLKFNKEDNSFSVVPHSTEDICDNKIYPVFTYNPELLERGMTLIMDDDRTTHTSLFSVRDILEQNGFILDSESSYQLYKIMSDIEEAHKLYMRSLKVHDQVFYSGRLRDYEIS